MQSFWYLASKTGLVSDGSQPTIDCAWPLKEAKSLQDYEAHSARHYDQALGLVNDKDWQIVNWKDPENGDMHLWTKPQVGRYHFMKITMSLPNTTPKRVLETVLTPELAGRKLFSADIVGLETLAMTENTTLEHASYTAPSPVAGRDFCLLLGNPRDIGNGTWMSYGCSVDSPKCPEQPPRVRGVCFFCWHVVPVGDHCMITYVNCLDPRGWTPPFVLAWLKGAATQEFINIRAIFAGRKPDVHLVSLNECGVSEDELKKAEQEQEREK